MFELETQGPLPFQTLLPFFTLMHRVRREMKLGCFCQKKKLSASDDEGEKI